MPSGRCAYAELSPDATVSELKAAAQRKLGRHFLSLTSKGCPLDPRATLSEAGVGPGSKCEEHPSGVPGPWGVALVQLE